MTDYWWPLDLSQKAQSAVEKSKEYFGENSVQIDQQEADRIHDMCAGLMKSNLQEILERDSLPNLCHIINGWGNGRTGDYLLTDYLQNFIHYNEEGKPYILQCLPEGDFHPWQSFAYAVMAGVSPDTRIGTTGFTLGEVAKNSRYVHHHEGEELGHLLFALAYLEGKPDIDPIQFKERILDLEELMDWAIESHITGTFRVCRKFHLTEGLCAVSTKVEGFQPYKEIAEGFLKGQLDMIFIMALIMEEALQAFRSGKRIDNDSLVAELREEIVVLEFLENHLYYAGHIIELASFAHLLGFKISDAHRNAIAFVINSLNEVFPAYMPALSFSEGFLGIGHYRRAVTLIMKIFEREEAGLPMDYAMLRDYTVDFNETTALEFSEEEKRKSRELAKKEIFKLATPSPKTNEVLQRIVDAYDSMNTEQGFHLRSKFPHFRRVVPAGWPRSVHFELLDYEDDKGTLGIEFHLESEEVKFLQKHLEALRDKLAKVFPGDNVRFDHEWYYGRGRVYFTLPAITPPAEVAEKFYTFVTQSHPFVHEKLKEQFSYLQKEEDSKVIF